jgi:hypothetical protein
MFGMHHHHQPSVRCFDRDAAQYRALAQHYAGIHDIPVAAIIGSVGRAHELRADFRSTCGPKDEQRYHRICTAMACGAMLPPIEVYQLGERYYVLDGNHRVAAALATGLLSLDAVVVAFQPVATAAHPAAA